MANDLRLFVTVTTSRRLSTNELRNLGAKVIAKTRRASGPFPYVWVPEVGTKGRPHLHLLLPHAAGRRFAEGWDQGFVHSVEATTADDVRNIATYIGKDFDQERERNETGKRYAIGRCFAPEEFVVEASGMDEFLAEVSSRMGAEPGRIDRWSTPGLGPCLRAFWSGPQDSVIRAGERSALVCSPNDERRTLEGKSI